LANANIVSMVVSPDGQWLLGLDSNSSLVTIDEFQIGSTGLLTLETGAQYQLKSGDPIVASNIAVSPNGDYVAAAVGTGGAVLFSFNTTTGALAPVYEAFPGSTTSADQAVAFDSASATLYVARSGTAGGVIPYTIGTGGVLTAVTGAPFATGNGSSSIVIDKTGKYLYVGNRTDSTISGFSIGSGAVLTALSGSPYPTGINVDALGTDNSGDYVLATAGGGTPDLDMFSFDATALGKLDAATTASTGDPTEPAGAVAIALTH
jgi:6-phosphogluconolactonase (cycloisomerase 2 family)